MVEVSCAGGDVPRVIDSDSTMGYYGMVEYHLPPRMFLVQMVCPNMK